MAPITLYATSMNLYRELAPKNEGFLPPESSILPSSYFEPIYRVKEVDDIPTWDSEEDFNFETPRDVFIRSVIELSDNGDARPAVGKIHRRESYMNIFTYWPGQGGEAKAEVLWVYETDKDGNAILNADGTPKIKMDIGNDGVSRPMTWALEDLTGNGFKISLPSEAWRLRQLFNDPLNASVLHIEGLANIEQGPNSYYIDDPLFRKERKDKRRSVERETRAYLEALNEKMVRPLVDYLNLSTDLDEYADDADFLSALQKYALQNPEGFLSRTKNNANLGNELLLRAAYQARVLQGHGPDGIFYFAPGSKPRLIGTNSHLAIGYLMDNEAVMADVVKRSGFADLMPYLPIAASAVRAEALAAGPDEGLRKELEELREQIKILANASKAAPSMSNPAAEAAPKTRGRGRPRKQVSE